MKDQISLIFLNLNYIIPPVIAIVLILKVVMFLRFKTDQRRFVDLVYFNSNQIVSNKAHEKVNFKIIQNSLTFYFVFLILFDIFLLICSPK